MCHRVNKLLIVFETHLFYFDSIFDVRAKRENGWTKFPLCLSSCLTRSNTICWHKNIKIEWFRFRVPECFPGVDFDIQYEKWWRSFGYRFYLKKKKKSKAAETETKSKKKKRGIEKDERTVKAHSNKYCIIVTIKTTRPSTYCLFCVAFFFFFILFSSPFAVRCFFFLCFVSFS